MPKGWILAFLPTYRYARQESHKKCSKGNCYLLEDVLQHNDKTLVLVCFYSYMINNLSFISMYATFPYFFLNSLQYLHRKTPSILHLYSFIPPLVFYLQHRDAHCLRSTDATVCQFLPHLHLLARNACFFLCFQSHLSAVLLLHFQAQHTEGRGRIVRGKYYHPESNRRTRTIASVLLFCCFGQESKSS